MVKHIMIYSHIMKNHFFMPYYGNKRQEVEKIYEVIKDKLFDCEYIIEPFGGSGALSYYISTLHPGKFKYIINDNNDILIEAYRLARNKEDWDKMVDRVIELYNTITCKADYQKIIKEESMESFFIKNKIYAIRPGLYPTGKKYGKDYLENIKKAPILDFLRTENVILLSSDASALIKQFMDNNKAFIFLDPPYLGTDNSWYKTPTTNIYEYLLDNDICKMKAYVVLCLQNNWIIKLLFKGKNNITYDKKYETTKKTITHIIIDNTIINKEG